MPILLDKPQEEVIQKQSKVLVDTVKIIRIDIHVLLKKIVFTIGYGYNENNFTVVKEKIITIEGDDFGKLSSRLIEASDADKSLYDLVGETCYKYLMDNNLI